MRAVIDTNVWVDFLNGVTQARDEIALHASPMISAITWMELMVGTLDRDEEAILRSFLRRFERIPIDVEVCELAVQVRKAHRMRLPDAIIWACAKARGAILVTRNTKDFPASDPGIRVPYRLP